MDTYRIEYFNEHCYLHADEINAETYEEAEEYAREQINIIAANVGAEPIDIDNLSFTIEEIESEDK